MKLKIKQNHMIDFIFPISLYFVFALCALLVILLATDIYSGVAREAQMNFSSRTTLTYINTKIRQNDASNAITIEDFQGVDALIIRENTPAGTFVTYIYAHENQLKELYMIEGAQVSLAAGKAIMDVQDFQMEDLGNHLFRFTVIDETGARNQVTVGVKSPYYDSEGGES